MGKLEITSRQAEKLAVLPHRQLSPHLENCCLRLSANVSYEQAEQDMTYLTGIRIPAKTQQRLVHRQQFALPSIEHNIEELWGRADIEPKKVQHRLRTLSLSGSQGTVDLTCTAETLD